MEKFDRIIDVGKGKHSFVYFLIGIDEVVYVGQTRVGLSRPMQHHNVKGFNKIGIIDCKPEQLNKMEEFYIIKYLPIYNGLDNELSHKCFFSKVRELVKRHSGKELSDEDIINYNFEFSKPSFVRNTVTLREIMGLARHIMRDIMGIL